MFEEWLLFLGPIAVVVVAISIQIEASGLVAVFMRGLGGACLAGIAFWSLWPFLAQRELLPGALAPIAWVLCGAYLSLPFGPKGAAIGGAVGVVLWGALRFARERR